MLHRFRDITTLTVYVTAYDLEKSFTFEIAIHMIHMRFPTHV